MPTYEKNNLGSNTFAPQSCARRHIFGYILTNRLHAPPLLHADDWFSCATFVLLFEQDKVTLRNQVDPRARATLLNPDHLYDDLGDDVKQMVRALAACRHGAKSEQSSAKKNPTEGENRQPLFTPLSLSSLPVSDKISL